MSLKVDKSISAINGDILNQVMRVLGPRHQLLVGYSGGLDSTVLLHLLMSVREKTLPGLALRAIYIDHGLTAFAESWVNHCQNQCQAWRIPLKIVKVQVDPRPEGVEAAARKARYTAFKTHLAHHEVLLTAQHQDDQCETLLLALKRGSGPAGLSSMTAAQPFADSQLLRPLLDIPRRALEAYAQQHQLHWIEDDSNQNDRFDRNFLRLRILPLLRQRWPHFAQTTARSASLCAEQEQLLDELLAGSLQDLISPDRSLSIDGLLPMSDAKRYAVLRRWIASGGLLMPSRGQLQRLWHEVALSRQDANPQLQLGDHQVRRFHQRLYLLPLMRSLQGRVLDWPLPEALVLPDGIGVLSRAGAGEQKVRAPHRDEKVTVRFSLPGRVHLAGRPYSRQSKKLWQEMGIPPWKRERIPLLYFDEHLIAALGIFVTLEGQAKVGEESWYLRWEAT